MDYSNEILLRGSIYRRTSGKAFLAFDEGQLASCDFGLIQYQKGSILAFCKISPENIGAVLPLVFSTDAAIVSFEGETQDGFLIELANIMVINRNFHSTSGEPVEIGFVLIASEAHFVATQTDSKISFLQIRFPLANLDLPPTPPIQYANPLGVVSTSSVARLILDDTTLYMEATENASTILQELKYTKGVAVTATAFTFCNPNEYTKVDNLLCSLNTVLTFLQGTRINRLGYDVLTPHNEIIESRWYDAVTRPYSDSTLINRLLSKDVKLRMGHDLWVQSVQSMFAEFIAKDKDWDMTELIYAFTDAATEGDYLELRGLKICGCMEVLRARFLDLNKKTYLTEKSKFDAILPELQGRVIELLHEMLPNLDESTYTAMSKHLSGLNYFPFRRALRQFCKEVSLQATKPTNKETKNATDTTLGAFVAVRNALVHYGRFAIPRESTEEWTDERCSTARWRQYQFIERLNAGMLAALLGWMRIKPETKMPDAPDFWEE